MNPAPPHDTRPWQAQLPFYYGWVIVGVGFAGSFIFIGIQFWALSIISLPMTEDLGWSRSAIFGPLALRTVIAAAGAPLFARYLDREHGARVLITVGSLFTALTYGLLSMVQEEWHYLLLFGVLGGMAGWGQAFAIATAIVPKWFVRRRGRAIGIAVAGPGVAALALPLIVTVVIDNVGWRGTWVVIGVVFFLLTVPAAAWLLRRQPEDIGLLPDGAKPRGRPGSPEGPPPLVEHSYTAREAFHSRTLYLLVGAVALAQASLIGIPTAMVPLFQDRGASPAQAAMALTLYGVTSTLARFGWGYLADKRDVRFAIVVLAGYGTVVELAFIPASGSLAAIVVLALLAGYAIGGILTLNATIWAAYFGRRHLGAIIGVTQPVVAVSAGIGPLLMAQTFDRTGSYALGLVILSVSWALCGVLMLLAGVPQRPKAGESPPATTGGGAPT